MLIILYFTVPLSESVGKFSFKTDTISPTVCPFAMGKITSIETFERISIRVSLLPISALPKIGKITFVDSPYI